MNSTKSRFSRKKNPRPKCNNILNCESNDRIDSKTLDSEMHDHSPVIPFITSSLIASNSSMGKSKPSNNKSRVKFNAPSPPVKTSLCRKPSKYFLTRTAKKPVDYTLSNYWDSALVVCPLKQRLVNSSARYTKKRFRLSEPDCDYELSEDDDELSLGSDDGPPDSDSDDQFSFRKTSSIAMSKLVQRLKKSNKPMTRTSLPNRVTPTAKPETDMELARSMLHVSTVPDDLPCREREFESIFTFVENHLLNATGGCMYISGVPGTGKTSTVMEVIRSLLQMSTNGEVKQFNFIEVNGMLVTIPAKIMPEILYQLTGEKVAPDHATEILDKKFTFRRKSERSIILLVDELDLLLTKNLSVIYNLFDWPNRPKSNLIVLAIANTMDLPERILSNKITSRIGLCRLTFNPYSYKQLQAIIESRLNVTRVFSSDAIQLAARKVAAISGDARRALELCRLATEIGNDSTIEIGHIHQAAQNMFSCPVVQAIAQCSSIEKAWIRGIVLEFRRTGLEEAVFNRAYLQMTEICRLDGLPVINRSRANILLYSLANQRILLVEDSTNHLTKLIRLNASIDDAMYALN